eukprot:4778584-Prorocentrum_lima.AAC.1
MTSSLVGSEMCIRDSSAPLASVRPQGLSAKLQVGLEPIRVTAIWQPVSYTHLTLPTICSV